MFLHLSQQWPLTLPAAHLKRRLVEEQRQRAWQLWCQGLPQHAIAKQLGLSESSVKKYIATVRNRHPAQEMTDGDKFTESYEMLRECGLLIRQELAAAKAAGEDLKPLLGTLSVHVDRHARFLTRQQAVPVLEVNQTNQFDSSLWASLLGANAQAPLADASAEALPEVVEALTPTSSPQDEQTMPEKAVHN